MTSKLVNSKRLLVDLTTSVFLFLSFGSKLCHLTSLVNLTNLHEPADIIFKLQFRNVTCTDGGEPSDEGGARKDEEHKREKHVLAGRSSI